MNEKIKPELLGGFRDFLPEDMIPRQEMIDRIRRLFEKFGFVPLETPVVERLDVLTGKNKDFSMALFRAGIVPGLKKPKASSFEEMALRYDLTVPLARVVAANQGLIKPFKRYQVGPVFRGERQQKGRFRGFYQFDADIIGSSSILADMEIIWLMIETMKSLLGSEDFIVRTNNRKILNGLAKVANFAGQKKKVFRILDKLDKIGWEKVKKELQQIDVSSEGVKKIEEFLKLKGRPEEILDKLEKDLFKGKTEIGAEGIRELREITKYLDETGVSRSNWKIDFSIARGLDYYTGTVFETELKGLPSIGSVFSGGRYDGLVSVFSLAKVPAVGASIGVDRLFVALETLGLIKKKRTLTEVLIALFDRDLIPDYLSIAKELRDNEIKTEIFLGEEKSLKGQINYALKKGIPRILIFGSEEKKEGTVVVKSLEMRKQEKVSLAELVSYLKGN